MQAKTSRTKKTATGIFARGVEVGWMILDQLGVAAGKGGSAARRIHFVLQRANGQASPPRLANTIFQSFWAPGWRLRNLSRSKVDACHLNACDLE